MIKWIDNKSVLRNGKKVYKSGMEIPDDILSDSRIDTFLREKKIKIVDYIEVDKSDKEIEKAAKAAKAKAAKAAKAKAESEKSVQAEISSDDRSKGVENESSQG